MQHLHCYKVILFHAIIDVFVKVLKLLFSLLGLIISSFTRLVEFVEVLRSLVGRLCNVLVKNVKLIIFLFDLINLALIFVGIVVTTLLKCLL